MRRTRWRGQLQQSVFTVTEARGGVVTATDDGWLRPPPALTQLRAVSASAHGLLRESAAGRPLRLNPGSQSGKEEGMGRGIVHYASKNAARPITRSHHSRQRTGAARHRCRTRGRGCLHGNRRDGAGGGGRTLGHCRRVPLVDEHAAHGLVKVVHALEPLLPHDMQHLRERQGGGPGSEGGAGVRRGKGWGQGHRQGQQGGGRRRGGGAVVRERGGTGGGLVGASGRQRRGRVAGRRRREGGEIAPARRQR